MRVGLFATCLVDGLFPEVGRACVTLLRRLDIEVDVPTGQTCCGQMHVNSGYPRQALGVLRTQVAALAGYDLVVTPSASCAASMRHQWPELAAESGAPALQVEVARIVSRTYELTEFLVDRIGIDDVGARYPAGVAYHPTCHSLRLLRLGDRPQRLLAQVRDLQLHALPDAETCCGFGGTFALKNADTSAAMLDDKIASLIASGAEEVTATDSSCLMHLRGGLTRRGCAIRAVHIAEILAAT